MKDADNQREERLLEASARSASRITSATLEQIQKRLQSAITKRADSKAIEPYEQKDFKLSLLLEEQLKLMRK